MSQTWHDLLFAHWNIDSRMLRDLVPAQLELDTFEGRCWVGVVPFRMSAIHARWLPPIPGASAFPELNVRTYVKLDQKPGVYFFSLDAADRLAVWAARRFYRLPYFHAAMKCTPKREEILYDSRRYRGNAEFRARYRAMGPVRVRDRGTLEHWLTERYCLYATAGERAFRGEIHHQPWPLQDAEAEIEANTMTAASGIDLPRQSPLLHFAARLEVLIWPLQPAS